MNDFDRELLSKGVNKFDIDDFNNWCKHRPLTDKLDDFFTFYVLGTLYTIWNVIQIPFRGLEWWHKINEPLCNDPVFKAQFEKLFDDIECNRLEQAEQDLQLTNHYVEFWKSDKF